MEYSTLTSQTNITEEDLLSMYYSCVGVMMEEYLFLFEAEGMKMFIQSHLAIFFFCDVKMSTWLWKENTDNVRAGF